MSIIGRLLVRVTGGGTEPTVTLAAGQLGREGVEPLIPEPAEMVEPAIQLVERCRVDGIEPPGSCRPDRGEPAVTQHLEMLRHGRLGDPEFGLDDDGDLPGGQLPIGEELQDPASDRVAEDIERVHVPKI